MILLATGSKAIGYGEPSVCSFDSIQNGNSRWKNDISGYPQSDYKQALNLWTSFANAGDPKYQFYLAKMYQFGDGVAVDLEKTLYWYRKSSEQGYPPAQNNYALMYESGEGIRQDHIRALELMCVAAQAGFSVSQFNMGRYYQYGIGVKADGILAESWYEMAIKQGHTGAMYNLGVMYSQGVMAKQDVEFSTKLIKESAEKGLPPAIHDMGNIYFNGINDVDVSLEEAIKWYKRGVESGVPESSYMLGIIHFDHKNKFFDANKALEYMRAAADMGLIGAIQDLGNRYQYGDGVVKNLTESLKWFKKGSSLGDSISSFLVSYAYIKGHGVEKDEKESFLWSIKAAEQGHVSSMVLVADGYLYGYMINKDIIKAIKYLKDVVLVGDKEEKINAAKKLGWIYKKGDNIDVNMQEAARWFEVSAELGDAESQNNLGLFYHNGQGVRKDIKVALYWYRMAANQGYGFAQNNLGIMYERGDGVDVDYKEAVYWFEKAADNGVYLAMRNLGLIYLNGRGISKDVTKGMNLLEKAMSKGDIQAKFSLATMYDLSNDIKQDHQKAFSMYHDIAMITKSEKLNQTSDIGKTVLAAQTAVARMYLDGRGVDKNYKESFRWFMQAHNNGLPVLYDDVEHSIATAYIYGWGVEQSIEKAKEFDRVAVNEYLEQVIPLEEQIDIAKDYMFVIKDEKKAVAILEKMGHAGSISAQKWLGAIYSNKGFYLQIDKDIGKAEYWYEKAIDQGDVEAEANLGAYYIYNSINKHGVRNAQREEKGFYLSKSAKDKGYIPSIDVLAFAYRFGAGVSIDIKKAVTLLQDKLDLALSEKDKNNTLLKILDIQIEHNLYDEVTPEAFLVLRKKAMSGDHAMQLKLGNYYLLDKFKYSDVVEGKKWIKEASKKTIEANIILANSSFGFGDFEFDYGNVEKYMRNAIALFESREAIDYGLFASFRKDRIIDLYQEAATMYVERGMYELSESMLRKSSAMNDGAVEQFIDKRDIILAQMSSDHEYIEDKLIAVLSKYNNADNIKNGIDGELLFAALDGLSEHYEKRGDILKSALFIENEMGKLERIIQERDASFFATYFYLEIARKYIRVHNKEKAEYFFDKYKQWIDKKEIKEDRKLGQMMGMAVSSYIAVENNKIKDAQQSLLKLLSWMDHTDVPVTPWSFTLANEITERMREKGYNEEAFVLMDKVVDLYKKFLKRRIRDGSRLTVEQRVSAKNVISDYLHLARLSNHDVDDQGFDLLQLTSGLSSSQSVLNAIQRSYMSKVAAIKSKEIEELSKLKNKLLNEKYATLGGREGSLESINSALDRIDQEVQLLRHEVNIELSKNSDLVWNDLLKPTAAVQSVITDSDALLSMMVSKNRTHVWLITKQGVFRQSHPVGIDEISTHVHNLLESLNPKNNSINELSLGSSGFLYDILIRPFSGQLSTIDRLIVAPDSAFSTIPFSILVDTRRQGVKQIMPELELELLHVNSVTRGIEQTHEFSENKNINYQDVSWLINQFAIAVTPSIYSYVESEVKQKIDNKNIIAIEPSKFLGVGNPILVGNHNSIDVAQVVTHIDLRGSVAGALHELAPLPETEAELIAIGNSFEHADLMTGEKATEKKLREMDLMPYEVISFATHALVSNEIENYLNPSLVLTPVDVGVPSNDGLLTSKEVSALHMDADIVLLSACNTASSSGESNGEGLSGLADAFFQAGAKSLLVSYWPVMSDAAVNITTRMFGKDNHGKSYAHKHRNSLLSLINSDDKKVSHPTYWAPFSVIGVY